MVLLIWYYSLPENLCTFSQAYEMRIVCVIYNIVRGYVMDISGGSGTPCLARYYKTK